MPETYSASLRLTLIGNGDLDNTWGVTANGNMSLIEAAICGVSSQTITGLSTYALTTANGAPDQARAPYFVFFGTLSAPCTVTVPAVEKITTYVNSTNNSVILTTGSGTTFTLQAGCGAKTYCDGTNVYDIAYYDGMWQSAPLVIPSVSTNTQTITAPYTEFFSYGGYETFSSGSTTTAFSINAAGAIIGTTFYVMSDGRRKSDIRDLTPDDAGAMVDELARIVRTFVMDGETGRRAGWVAQDVVRAWVPRGLVGMVPDAAMERVEDADGFVSPAGQRLTVDMVSLIPHLVAAVADLRRRVAVLEA